MFSSISSMIWGEEQETSSTLASLPRSESPAGEDWVLVGPSSPAPGDLATLQPLRPSPSDTSSTPPSSSSSELGEEVEAVPLPRGRPHASSTRLDALAAAEVKSSKYAQLVMQRNSGKSLSSKALSRSNKCMVVEASRTRSTRSSYPIKMAGNKTLKQC